MSYLNFALIIALILLQLLSGRKEQKRVYILIVIMYILLFGGSNGSPDYYNYSTMFYGRESSYKSIEYIYYFILHLFRTMGFSYDVFNLLFYAISIVVLCYAAYLCVGSSTGFLFLYLFWPAFIDWVQIRNFFAMSLLTLGVVVLTKKNKHAKLYFCILILFATGFQVLSIAYLPIVFLDHLNEKSIKKYAVGVVAITAIIFSLPKGFISQISSILSSVNLDGRFSLYLGNSVRMGYYMNWGIQIGNYVLTVWGKNILKKRQLENTLMKTQKEFIDLMCNIQLYMFIFFPLYRLNTNFLRLTRNIFPLMYMEFIIINRKLIKKKFQIERELLIFDIVFLAFVSLIIYVQLIIPHWDDVILQLYSKRWLL